MPEVPPDAILPAEIESPEQWYSRRIASWGLHGFLRFAGQARSRSARDILVRAASEGRYTGDDLVRWTTAPTPGHADEVGSCNLRMLLATATLIGNQRLDDDDLTGSAALFDLLEQVHGPLSFTRIDRIHYLEILSEIGDRARFNTAFRANALVEADWAQALLLAANLTNPWTSPEDGDGDRWHTLVNALYRAAGVEPIHVLEGAGDPMDRILSAARSHVGTGPRVTVLVPTHNPDRRLGTALASLLGQSWTNLEVLVLDDGSEPAYRHRLQAWAERDDRIRVLRMARNIGNYAARNIGMDEATGEFVTVHDDDDWSHPRKIELQVTHLVENPDQLANMSQLIRTTPDLRFVRINSNPMWVQPNYSSLMYRRAPVLDLVGYWDEVNRSADAEYRNRLTTASGEAPTVVGGAPMSFLRVREGSLTHGEIQRAHIDPRRSWYDLGSRAWHERAAGNGDTLRLSPAPPTRPFAAPWGMTPGHSDRLVLDVVYATDFRFPGGNTSVSVNEISSMLDAGLRVGMMQLDSPVLVATTALNPRATDLALRDGCHVVTVNDDVEADLLVVRHPTVLQFAERRRTRVAARRHVVIVNHAPAMRDGTEAHYEINTCVENYERMFGATPVVAPESGAIRACLAPRLRSAALAPFDWTGTIGQVAPEARHADPGRPPVLGRHSRDNREKWPQDPEAIRGAYPVTGMDVRILGGARTAIERLGADPEGWRVHEFGSRLPADFLRELDFWVYFHDENLIESFGMATLEAMAAGLVVVLPAYMRATFGEGAVYCEPAGVRDLVESLWSDRQAYHRQSELALDTVRRRFLTETFSKRLDEVRT